jgi:quinol monooxygenase YgiN
MNQYQEFNSEFCNIKYIEEDNIVFLTWKKFCSFKDYRTPTTFALDLLKGNANSNFVVDARNGFEDDKEDVEWGFTFLLPEISKTDCKYVVFILNEVKEIEEEMDLWTKEFGKYFTVIKAKSYVEALDKMKKSLFIHVTYTVKEGKRAEFLKKVYDLGIVTGSRQEPGNAKYEYFYPHDKEDRLFLLEEWADKDSQEFHGKTEHFRKLQDLKSEYVIDTRIEKYIVNKQ